MYQNAGQSIKNVVSIIVKIGYTCSILAAVVIFISGVSSNIPGVAVASMFSAVIVGGLGCLSSWLSGLWLYAYGEITDRLISIDEKLKDQNKVAAPASASAVASYSAVERGSYCPNCGAKNSSGAMYCIACSADLMESKVSKVPAGGWRCSCGRANASYVTTCTCGKNKREVTNS